jgi:Ca2+-binding EF-hand superfamily protein
MTEKEIKETLSTKDFIKLPENLNKKCTQEEFHKMMTSQNSDIPIETVKFQDFHNIKME